MHFISKKIFLLSIFSIATPVSAKNDIGVPVFINTSPSAFTCKSACGLSSAYTIIIRPYNAGLLSAEIYSSVADYLYKLIVTVYVSKHEDLDNALVNFKGSYNGENFNLDIVLKEEQGKCIGYPYPGYFSFKHPVYIGEQSNVRISCEKG